MRLTSSSEYLALSRCLLAAPATDARKHLQQKSRSGDSYEVLHPHSATHMLERLPCRLPVHSDAPPSGFFNLATVYSRACWTVLFRTACTRRVHPQKNTSTNCRYRFSSALIPPCRWRLLSQEASTSRFFDSPLRYLLTLRPSVGPSGLFPSRALSFP